MAEPHAASDPDFAPGEMKIVEQTSTYRVFDTLVRWGSLGVAALVLFLTVMFCTGAGLIGAAVPTVVLLAIGVVVLRRGPTSLDTH